MSKASKKSGKRRAADLSTPQGSEAESPTRDGEAKRTGMESVPSMSERAKMRGPISDARRCTATANRTGERCRAPAIIGGRTCRVHGGAAPQVKKKAQERLLELVDPALAALSKVLHNPLTDDSVKVRAATAILDRTGFRPGVVVQHTTDDPFSAMLADLVNDDGTITEDRSLEGTTEQDAIEARAYAESVHGQALRDEAWNKLDDDDLNADERTRARYDPATVVPGEVVTPPPSPGGGGMSNQREYEDGLRDRLNGERGGR